MMETRLDQIRSAMAMAFKDGQLLRNADNDWVEKAFIWGATWADGFPQTPITKIQTGSKPESEDK